MAASLVSIIIPCYNAAKYLPDCLEGILAQEYPDKEVVLVDGGSTDGTLEIITEYSARYSFIRWTSEKDRGVYDAMNKGVRQAAGEWLYFLGADDGFYDPKVLADVFAGGRAEGVDMIYGNVEFRYSKRIYDGAFSLRRLLFESNICHQAIFYRADVFDRVGLYEIACKVYADRDLNIRCYLEQGLRIKFYDRIIAVYNERDGLSAAVNADPVFRERQQKYIDNYNNKPVRAFVIRLRRFAGVLKKRLSNSKQ